MRLVDADAVDDIIQTLNENGWHITRNEHKRIDRILFEIPTVDAVEVVRCKECRWFYDCRKDGWGRCGEHDDYGRDSGWWQATDFCSWGEKI